jgi:uncharacterized SAM-binding protein YcdF (DUF218 family)
MAYFEEDSFGRTPRRPSRTGFWALVALIVFAGLAALLAWKGGDLLVVSDPLPAHAQAAVMLDGSLGAVRARSTEALRLLAERRVDHVVISVPRIGDWGVSIPEAARRYVEKEYGAGLADHVIFCPMSPRVNSTAEEAVGLEGCLEQHDWHSVIVVTSNYHTRRARLVWRETLADAHPPFQMWIDGIEDGDFEPTRWWSQRRYAKTWVEETTKLVWIEVVGINVWK